MVLRKHEIEAALAIEAQAISAGKLKEDNPLDLSQDFDNFCQACRRGDLKVCQEHIQKGVNINARDRFDYTPLILASLCGHYEVARLLLENGALCERDTFQGERCLYNALNDRIRNLLLSYDYAKSTNPLQPLAAHITSLLTRPSPKTSDITLVTYDATFELHKFLLAARSPYFARKLASAPETKSWKLSPNIPTDSLRAVIQHLYFSEVSTRTATQGLNEEEEKAVFTGIDKLSRQLETEGVFESITELDRRQERQRRTEELEKGRDQLATWFKDNVLRNKMVVDTDKVDSIKWDRDNSIFADILLRADDDDPNNPTNSSETTPSEPTTRQTTGPLNGIPIGPNQSLPPSQHRTPKKSTLYPAHRAMLLRSEYFLTMFSSGFREAQSTPVLQIITIDCNPAVLEIILTYLYTERADFDLTHAIDVLFTADLLFIEKLKQRAALIISTLGNGAVGGEKETDEDEVLDIYEVIRAGWDTRVPRLEEFGARYIAYRLEHYIDDPQFAELVVESAKRIKGRQETDTVELVDDIRYYLSERFRLRFEDSGLDEMMDEKDVEGKMGEMMLEERERKVENGNGNVGVTDGGGPFGGTVIRTIDGEIAGDEFTQDAINYQILLGKIDELLEKLNLDA